MKGTRISRKMPMTLLGLGLLLAVIYVLARVLE
jgi:hypothetical protein